MWPQIFNFFCSSKKNGIVKTTIEKVLEKTQMLPGGQNERIWQGSNFLSKVEDVIIFLEGVKAL